MYVRETVPDLCTSCQRPLEIAAVRFSFLMPCRALFVCTSCGQMFSENGEGSEQKGAGYANLGSTQYSLQHLKHRFIGGIGDIDCEAPPPFLTSVH
jgi:predicted RNA-binding Zn-ribbon protein involved in translation (DUF1610 family)